MERARPVIEQANKEYKEIVGRGYGVIEAVDTEDAEIVLATSGAMTSTARVAIASLQGKRGRGGPPQDEGLPALPHGGGEVGAKHVPKVAVLDRNISLAREGYGARS